MRASVEALMAAETLAEWIHCATPLESWELYTAITEGLIEAKRQHRAALVLHDRARAAGLLAEIQDLNHLAGEAATALALARARFLAQGHAWPLAALNTGFG